MKRHAAAGENGGLDTPLRSGEDKPPLGVELSSRVGERQRRHEVAASAATSQQDGRHSPAGRPRCFPIDTITPAERRQSTSETRPIDMNGSVSPVVGINQVTTAACMIAVTPMPTVRPEAR